MSDPVNNPPHYNQGQIECIDAIREMLGLEGFIAYCRGNALKYTWRCKYKGRPAEDLAKAQWYLRRAKDAEHILFKERQTQEMVDRGREIVLKKYEEDAKKQFIPELYDRERPETD